MLSTLIVHSDILRHFAVTCNVNTSFLGLEPWYHYLKMDGSSGSCQVTNFQLLGSNSSLVLILMALIDDLLRIAGFAAVLIVIYAGIKYITSTGSPDKTGQAQSTLINALIGLAISLIAIQTVSFLGNKLAGGSLGGNGNVGGIDLSPLPAVAADTSLVQTILTFIFGIAGALSFTFLVFGGFRYVLAQGDPQATAKAKSTIMYALIGVVVTILGQALVVVVIKLLTS